MNGSPIKRVSVRREPSTPRKQVRSTHQLLTPDPSPENAKTGLLAELGEGPIDLFGGRGAHSPVKKRKMLEEAATESTTAAALVATIAKPAFEELSHKSLARLGAEQSTEPTAKASGKRPSATQIDTASQVQSEAAFDTHEADLGAPAFARRQAAAPQVTQPVARPALSCEAASGEASSAGASARPRHTVYAAGKALFQRGSKVRNVVGREDERALIKGKLQHCIRTHTNGALYVSGLPGTGKSALVAEILSELAASEQLELPAGEPRAHIAQINCMTIDKPDQTYEVVAKEFGYLGRRAHKTREQAIELLSGEFARRSTSHILILDELDRIVTADQEVMFRIFEWACGSSNLVVVGIANAIDLTDRFLPRLQAHKLKPQVVAFKPYTAQGITKIIEARLRLLDGPLMHPAAVRICAAKTAANSGDLRKAFDVCRRAIEVVEEEAMLAQRAQSDGAGAGSPAPAPAVVVTTRHVAKVCQKAFGGVDARERLRLLNFQQRAVLCVLIKTERSATQANVTVAQAFQEYQQRCAQNAAINGLAYPEYMDVVGALEAAGLVAVTGLCGKKGLGSRGSVRTSRGGGGASMSKGSEGYRDEFGQRKITSRAQLLDVLHELADNDPLRFILVDNVFM